MVTARVCMDWSEEALSCRLAGGEPSVTPLTLPTPASCDAAETGDEAMASSRVGPDFAGRCERRRRTFSVETWDEGEAAADEDLEASPIDEGERKEMERSWFRRNAR